MRTPQVLNQTRTTIGEEVGRKIVMYLSLGLEQCHIPIESACRGTSFTGQASDVRRAFGYDGDLIACHDHAHTYTQPRARVI
jgi:hypothetical protein